MMKFIRFGKIPENEKSGVYDDSGKIGEEIGVSVYETVKVNGEYRVVMPLNITYSSCVTLSGCIDREKLIVTGDRIGTGSDGEPLIKNIKIKQRSRKLYNRVGKI